MPLRRLLPLLTAALVALALLVAGVLAATAMRTYLVQQVDRGLMRSPTATSQGPPPPQQAGSGSPLPSDFYVQVSDDSGTVVQQISNLPSGLQAPTLPALTRAEVIATGSQPFTADGWRVVAKTTPTGTVMVAKSLVRCFGHRGSADLAGGRCRPGRAHSGRRVEHGGCPALPAAFADRREHGCGDHGWRPQRTRARSPHRHGGR
ncbi:MAG: hypothetical protein V9G10_09950 [Candidatus Nanopelagicales bacterium]